MKRKVLPLMIMLSLISSNATFVFAQQAVSTSDWAAVQQVKTNDKLIVKKKAGKEVSGRMIEATDSMLTIEHDGKPLSIPRAEVRQVHRVAGKAAKGKWAAIGTAIGAGTGAAIGATKYSSDRDDSGIYPMMGFLIGAGSGAVGGLVFGQSRRKHELVYGVY